jgi:hypothetical protein
LPLNWDSLTGLPLISLRVKSGAGEGVFAKTESAWKKVNNNKKSKEFIYKLTRYVIPACRVASGDSLRRESFLKNQKDCGQAAMTEINKESDFILSLISNFIISENSLPCIE